MGSRSRLPTDRKAHSQCLILSTDRGGCRPPRKRIRSESLCVRRIQRGDRLGEADDLSMDQPLVEFVEVQFFRMSSGTSLQQVGRQRAQGNRAKPTSVQRRALAEEKRHRLQRDDWISDAVE